MRLGKCLRLAGSLASSLFLTTVISLSVEAGSPGGFIEKADSTDVRPLYTQTQIQNFVPSTRGTFTFPAPYNTEGVRITIPSDCGRNDCLHDVGYSYWANMSAHEGSDTIYIFLSLEKTRGGGGPTLFSYNKVTGAVTKLGPLFDSSSPWSNWAGGGWYFSASQQTKLYIYGYSSKFYRYDVISKTLTTVYDAAPRFGSDKIINQAHSSADDRVHSATLTCLNAGCSDGFHVAQSADEMMGCMVYQEGTQQFLYYPRKGLFNECQIDKSGRWLITFEDVDGVYADGYVDNVVYDLQTGQERTLLANQENILGTAYGAVAHQDVGYGYIVGGDSSYNLANAKLLYNFNQTTLQGSLEYYTSQWAAAAPVHLSHLNGRSDISPDQQYTCGSGADAVNATRSNEISCFPLNGSMDVLVVAPVMTDMNASGGDWGGCGYYCKLPKGNIDVTGQYFLWTSNMGGNRLDAFIVKVPGQLLTGATPPPASGDATAPTISSVSAPFVSSLAATITWTTNEASDSQVEYGVSTGYGNSTSINTTLLTSHSVSLSGLSASTIYHYRVKSRDGSGNLAISADFTFSTPSAPTSSPSDTTPPVVSITSPSSGAAVKGKIKIIASASDNVGLRGVQFQADGQNIGSEDTKSPFTITWNSGNVPDGVHTLTAIATDKAGNTQTSSVTVTVIGSRTAATRSRTQQVKWTNPINVTIAGNSLQESCGGCGNSGAQSSQGISSGNGYLRFTASETTTQRAIGLSRGNADNSRADIDFAIMLWEGGIFEVFEGGNFVWGDGAYVTGDVFRVSVESGVVNYSKNGTVFYTSANVPSYPLLVDSSLSTSGSTLANAIISGR